MGEDYKLSAESRAENENVKEIRKAGLVPAIVYGSGQKNLNFKIKAIDFSKLFEQAGESSLINLSIDGNEPLKVVVKDVERDPINGGLSHIDFYKVDMKKKITVEVELNFSGEAKAVTELGGVLSKAADNVEITCLPEDLINHLDVDLSVLNTMSDVIKMSDLKLPKGVELASETDDVLVSVVETVKEEVVAPVVTEAEAAAPVAGEEPAEKTEEKK